MDVHIEAGWKRALQTEFDQAYFTLLAQFLHREKKAGKCIYPPGNLIFNAFECTPYDKVRVVLLGQDPYHRPGQAHGLSFSVPQGIKFPPSLVNIFKELSDDIGCPFPTEGCLEKWARQGVLLLNAVLTVEAGQPTSHARIGWSTFTDAVIRTLNAEKNGLVFLLWGNYAREKKALIDTRRHYVLEAAHPSPLARGAFFGSKPFSKTNAILQSLGQSPIDWSL